MRLQHRHRHAVVEYRAAFDWS